MKFKRWFGGLIEFLRGEFWNSLNLGFALALCLVLITASTLPPAEAAARVRAYTRMVEFDYVSWTIDALGVKLGQASLGVPRLLSEKEQHDLVLEHIRLVSKIEQVEFEIEKIYSDPKVTDKAGALAPWQAQLNQYIEQNKRLGPMAEEIIQAQLSAVLEDLDLAVGGQVLPPVLYHVTPLPYALIVSPRNVIRQEQNISLLPDLTLGQMVELEQQVEKNLNYSALVVPVGGVGTYPTMVMRTTNVNWLPEVVGHEWVHNFLTLRPLGWNYETTPQLRTMNETTASLAGKEIGTAFIARFYPEYLPKPVQPVEKKPGEQPSKPSEPPPFDFNKEMRITRVTADQLLAEGKIEEAEAYMEARRQVFWDNGYLIRRLNQAYFAFHGAYADVPGGGSAGEDPVGPAVVALRAQSPSLAAFLNRISWMTSFSALEAAIREK